MKQPISLRRRHLMIAGLAGAAVPAGVFAGLAREEALGDSQIAGNVVVSGRVVDVHGEAIPGARVSSTPDVSAMTDGDGRFVLTMNVPRRRDVALRVSHADHPARVARLAHFDRDETGTWRTTVGIVAPLA